MTLYWDINKYLQWPFVQVKIVFILVNSIIENRAFQPFDTTIEIIVPLCYPVKEYQCCTIKKEMNSVFLLTVCYVVSNLKANISKMSPDIHCQIHIQYDHHSNKLKNWHFRPSIIQRNDQLVLYSMRLRCSTEWNHWLN